MRKIFSELFLRLSLFECYPEKRDLSKSPKNKNNNTVLPYAFAFLTHF